MTEIKGNKMIIISHLLIILVYIHHNTQVTRPFDVTGMCTMEHNVTLCSKIPLEVWNWPHKKQINIIILFISDVMKEIKLVLW
jgi:hypothetical protein